MNEAERERAEIEAAVEEGFSDLDHLLTPEERRLLREELIEALRTHPDTLRLLRAMGPAPVVDESGPTEKEPSSARGASGEGGT